MHQVGILGHHVRQSLRRNVRQLLPRCGVVLALAATSCGSQGDGNECSPGPSSSVMVIDKVTQGSLERIDILFAIDNSRSMADKQQILALAVPDLVKGLVNPSCIHPSTGEVVGVPAGPFDECPAGSQRAFPPVLDIHVGIVSSSLGGHGSDACLAHVAGKESNDDRGHLIARVDPSQPGMVETYQSLGFLAWDPAQQLDPPGEADLDTDSAGDSNAAALLPTLRDMVLGVGQIGCGYESQLESWYRFLVDPAPPLNVTLDASKNVLLEGVDTELLAQRKKFLRPDSLLAIILLTDENDCSIKESNQFYYAAQQKGGNGAPFHLPKARAICETDPNDECCFSCGQQPTGACPADPTCKTPDGKVAYHDDLTDNINLRCWDQKRRFGIDFLYPITRYADALRSPTVTDRAGQVVRNPLFDDLDLSDSNTLVRTSNMVFVAGIVGVPWQDIARTNESGIPDLLAGLDTSGSPHGGFKTADEMAQILPGKDYSTWDLVLGDPTGYPSPSSLPKDPLMRETFAPRTGQNPITGDPIVTSSTPLGNGINGHEQSIPKQDDLQYACIFPLVSVDPITGTISPARLDCASGGLASCDCEDQDNDSPLCDVNPMTGLPTDQVRAKAYPGIRELQLLKEIGSQGIVASVCPAQLLSPSERDFGYRPAIAAIVDRLGPQTANRCFARELAGDSQGEVSCIVVEARAAGNGCDCDSPGRTAVAAEHAGVVEAIQEEDEGAGFNCFCEIPQLANHDADVSKLECEANYDEPGYGLCACQYTPPDSPVLAGGEPVDGWCYVDPATGHGNPAIVESCPKYEARLLRFTGKGAPRPGATVFITCHGETEHPPRNCE